MSRSSIVLLFSFLSLAANAQRDSLRSSELNDQAVLWLILEDYQKALVTLDSAILFDSLNAQAYGNRSAAWDGLGVFDEALLNVNKAISIDSLNAAHYYNRGLLLKNNYQYYRSALDFKKAINLDPKHLLSINKLAYYYFEFKEDYDSCKKVIEDYMWYGTTKTKKDADLIGLHGYLKMKEGDLQGAITEFDLAISIDSTSAEAYFNRGLVYYKLKRYKPSIADYSKAIELGRSAPQTHYNRALSYEYLRDFESAIDDYDQELKMHGATANTFNNEVVVL